MRPLFWEMKMWQCHENGKMSVHQTDTWHPFFSRLSACHILSKVCSLGAVAGRMDGCVLLAAARRSGCAWKVWPIRSRSGKEENFARVQRCRWLHGHWASECLSTDVTVIIIVHPLCPGTVRMRA